MLDEEDILRSKEGQVEEMLGEEVATRAEEDAYFEEEVADHDSGGEH